MGSKMRRELHRVDSLNRCDVPLDTITTMPDVVDYFDTWGSANERMTAHYLLGRVFHDQGNGPVALRCYHDAVGYADTTAADCDFRRLSRIYGQMADLFHRQRAPRLEIDANSKAVEYAWRAKDTLAAITFYGYLAAPYHMLNDMDSALYYNQGAYSLFKAHHYPNYAAGMLPISIDIYIRQGKYHEASTLLGEYDRYSGFFDAQGNIQQGKEFYYHYKGAYYLGTDKSDSAEHYYRKLLSFRSDNDNAVAAYEGLLSLYKKLGKADSIFKYATLYCQYNDSASFAHSADEITRTQALYNYEEHERIAAQKSKENAYYKRLIIASIAVFLLLAYIAYRYVRALQRRKRNELMAANTEYSSLLLQYSKLQKDLSLSESGISQYRQAKEKEIQELQQKLALYLEAPQIAEHWNIEQAMLNSPIVTGLHELASHVKHPSAVQWKELREFVEQELPDFYQNINHRDGGLSPREVLVCILIRLQFSQGELSALLGVSKQRINNIKRDINQKLFKEEGAQTLNNHIFSI